MNRAVRLLQAGLRQVDVSERIGVSQSIISGLLRRYRETTSPAEQHPGHGRCMTSVQDKFLILNARIPS